MQEALWDHGQQAGALSNGYKMGRKSTGEAMQNSIVDIRESTGIQALHSANTKHKTIGTNATHCNL